MARCIDQAAYKSSLSLYGAGMAQGSHLGNSSTAGSAGAHTQNTAEMK